MSEFQDIERLLRLKRYERPPEDFYENFLEGFKERQRGEMLRQSARGLLCERVSTWFYGIGPRHWMAAGGAATAMIAAGFFLMPGSEENTGLMQIEEAGASLSQDSAEADDEDPAEKAASSADDSAETR
ncbi:MAG: hypothetical protein KDN19_05215 [Verrucomicrobiae bacterium]|nr:hypothetical protein [Verrucomicrobiae bacterium]